LSNQLREFVTQRVHCATMSVEWMRAALVAALAVGSSCAAPRAMLAPAAPSRPPRTEAIAARHAPATRDASVAAAAAPSLPAGPVILVTIDGARWQEVFEGSDTELSHAPRRASRELVPNLDRLARENGAAVGAPGRGLIRATGPNFVSLPGYTEILTGRAPIGCQDNTCATVAVPTLLDEAHASGAKVAAFGSWEMLDRAVSSRPGSFVVSCGRNGDAKVDPWPGSGDFRPDRMTAKLALGYLEREQPDVLYVGLGEPDEYGHHGDYAGYLRALTAADAFVGDLTAALGRMGQRGADTHLFVTADHGRARDFASHGGGSPESSRVWLVASGPSIVARGQVTSSHERHLADVAPTLRRVLALEPDRSGLRDHDDRAWRGEALHELFAD
jgi:hypothetical protein